MKDKKEIPKYHCAGSVKYYNSKMNYQKFKDGSNLRMITEVTSFADLHLINLREVSNEKNIRNII